MTAGHVGWDELAAGYAVNALEPEDEQAFLDHLRGCDRCEDALEELRVVTRELAYTVEATEPPPELGRRILEAAAAERPAVFGRTPPQPARTPKRSRPAGDRRRARVWQPTFRVASLASAAAVVAVLGLGVWNLSLRGDNTARQAALQRRTEALTCLAAPETAKFHLNSIGGQRATTCLAGGSAYVVADHLARNDAAASNYVLWWMDRDSTPHPVERFDVDAAGTAVFKLPVSVSAADVTAMAVSLEPGSALPRQPTRVIASGSAAKA